MIRTNERTKKESEGKNESMIYRGWLYMEMGLYKEQVTLGSCRTRPRDKSNTLFQGLCTHWKTLIRPTKTPKKWNGGMRDREEMEDGDARSL